jgi:hypothetical protein
MGTADATPRWCKQALADGKCDNLAAEGHAAALTSRALESVGL